MKTYFDTPPFASLEQPTRFYFVRHGESESNKRGRIQGRLDPDLSEAGRAHARAAGAWFSSRSLNAVFTSPLKRARHTAEEIAKAASAGKPNPLDDLVELDTGLFSGKRIGEIEQEFPDEWVRFQRQSWEAVPGAESIASLTVRAQAVWRHLISESIAGRPNLACVTHAGLLQWIIRTSFGVQGFGWMPVIRAGNCGIFCLSVAPVAADGEFPASFFAEWTLLNHVPYESTAQP